MQSLTLIEEHIYIFLPYTLNIQSTVHDVATVFQSYNGHEWLPERGIVHFIHPRNSSFHPPELTRIRLCFM